MKKIIITILALVVLSLALMADEVIFDKVDRDTASNIQGTVHVYSSVTGEELPNNDLTLVVNLYYDLENSIDHIHRDLFESVTLVTDENGNYSHNFSDPHGNFAYCDQVEVIFNGCHYTADYDGIVRIDIENHGEHPVDPATDPAEY